MREIIIHLTFLLFYPLLLTSVFTLACFFVFRLPFADSDFVSVDVKKVTPGSHQLQLAPRVRRRNLEDSRLHVFVLLVLIFEILLGIPVRTD